MMVEIVVVQTVDTAVEQLSADVVAVVEGVAAVAGVHPEPF